LECRSLPPFFDCFEKEWLMNRTDHLHSLLKTHMEFTQILRDRANIAEHPITQPTNSQILDKVNRPLMDIVKQQQLLIRMRISRTLSFVESIRRNIKNKSEQSRTLTIITSHRQIHVHYHITIYTFKPLDSNTRWAPTDTYMGFLFIILSFLFCMHIHGIFPSSLHYANHIYNR
jgi:hypothetical protein